MQTGWIRRVLVVEDQAALRMLICDMLERHGWVTAAAANANEATAVFSSFDPDALLTDIDLGSRPSGAELATMLATLAPHLGVVFLSSYPSAAAGAQAMGIPHAVFVSKQDLGAPTDLLAALDSALSRSPVPRREASVAPNDLSALTRHQLEILGMLSRGWSNEQIAEASSSSIRAVERSISRIFERLELTGNPAVNPRVAAAARYLATFGPAR